ncbi:MAG: hypothetical protein DRJ68_06570 [Thermoprotei archaeon]|nr:MAG: hypothetical protein DRJ68_06570 [Thermoprotei archaeon]
MVGFLEYSKWLKHFREIGSDRKKVYSTLLPRRFEKVKPLLDVVKIRFNVSEVQVLLEGLKPLLVIVDDKLYNEVEYPRKVKESRIKERHRRKLVLIADNIANYFRILYNNNPRRFREELERFEK